MQHLKAEDREAIEAVFRETQIEETARVLGISTDRIRVETSWKANGGLGVVTYVDGEVFDHNSEDGIRVYHAIRFALDLPINPGNLN